MEPVIVVTLSTFVITLAAVLSISALTTVALVIMIVFCTYRYKKATQNLWVLFLFIPCILPCMHYCITSRNNTYLTSQQCSVEMRSGKTPSSPPPHMSRDDLRPHEYEDVRELRATHRNDGGREDEPSIPAYCKLTQCPAYATASQVWRLIEQLHVTYSLCVQTLH